MCRLYAREKRLYGVEAHHFEEVPVLEIRQAGLSSAGNDEVGDNFQAGQ